MPILLPLALAPALLAGAALLPATESLPPLPLLKVANSFPPIRKQIEQAAAAARANPHDPAVNGKLGMVLDTYEQYESAAICYERAHLLEPGAFRWLYFLGWVEAGQGKYEEAIAALRAALQLRPDYLPARLKLGESLLGAGKWEESARGYESILAENPDCAAAHYGLGRARAAGGDEARAAESLERACGLFPSYGAAHYSLALVFRKLGKAQESQKQLGLYSQDPVSVPALGDALRREVQELNRAAVPHVRRGVLLEQAGKLEEAVAEHEKALQINPQDVQARINLISLYGRLGRVEKAEEHYRAILAVNPNRAEAHYNYGVLLFGQQKYAEAEQAFERALQINPYHAEAHNNLGYLLERQGRLEDARKQYEAAIADRPEYRLAHFHLGRLLVNQRRYDEAIRHLLKTVTPEDDSTPGYLYALAAAYGRAGDRRNALTYARRARDAAAARGQTRLLSSIERDLRALEQEDTHR